MSLMTVNMFSKQLDKCVRIQIAIPTLNFSTIHKTGARQAMWNEKLPVLWLLHGFGGSYKDWLTHSNVLEYSEEKGLALVSVEGGNSHYSRGFNGNNYSEFIGNELPKFLSRLFPFSTDKKDNIIAGLSMGAYGALKIGLKYSSRFGEIIAFSGGLDRQSVCQTILKAEEQGDQLEGMYVYCNGKNLRRAFGEDLRKFKGSGEDLFHIVNTFSSKSDKAKIQLYCGQQDSNLTINKEMYHLLQEKGFETSLSIEEGGHDWTYWDKSIKHALNSLLVDDVRNIF